MKIKRLLCCILLTSLLATLSCHQSYVYEGGDILTDISGITAPVATDGYDFTGEASFPEAAVGGTYDDAYDCTITLADSDTSVSGEGAVFAEGVLTVSAGGRYLISGKLSDGSIQVNNTADTDKVTLILNGVDIHCSDSAAVYIIESDETVILVPEGSVNLVSDGDSRSFPDDTQDEPDAAIFSKDDLKFKGDGSLFVAGNYLRGVHGKDDLSVDGLTLSVTAVDDGLRGKDSVKISGGVINIVAGADGIRTNNTTDEGKGMINISGGVIEVKAGLDAIQAVTDMTVSGGVMSLSSGGGSQNSSRTESGGNNPGWGSWGKPPAYGGMGSNNDEAETESAKGLKAAGTLTVSAGVIIIDSSDDSIHSNDTVNIAGGALSLCSGDDGIHADTALIVSGGAVEITKSYEGVEASDITISGGTLNIVSSDDGMNAAGGNDSSSQGGRPGMGGFSSSGNSTITFSGGTVVINASGDGVDSNGKIVMTGGSCIVFGPTDNGNGAMDYDSTFTVTGGTMIAFGSRGMAQGISSGSTQAYLFVGLESNGGIKVEVEDPAGNVVLCETPPKPFACVLITSPVLRSGVEYTFYLGDEELGSTEATIK